MVVGYCFALFAVWAGWSFLREVILWSQLLGLLWLDGDFPVELMSLWIMAVNNVQFMFTVLHICCAVLLDWIFCFLTLFSKPVS